MAPINVKESLDFIISLGDIFPPLAPAKGALQLISTIIEQVGDNTDQATYLFNRCTNLFLHVRKLCLDYQGNAAERYAKPLSELNITLDKIRISLTRLTKITPFRRFLQRHEISDSIAESHRSLDACIEIFDLQATAALAFIATDHEAARQRDQVQLGETLERLLQGNANILEALQLQGDQMVDAVLGLQGVISKGIDDAVQRQFAKQTLNTLLTQETGSYSPSQNMLYDWSISSLEIFIEGEKMGSGAFGTVYIGRWSGTRVAVKQLAVGTSRETLIQEVDVWRRLQHPHVASFFRACLESNPPCLVSELYVYGDAMKYLSKFPQANRVSMCHEISLGMGFLHGQKIVHGDLKPENVLIDDAHRARISDFGLSKVKSTVSTRTVSNPQVAKATPSGTRVFMPPERLMGGRLTYATDVYAFAMTMYQIMTDEVPFQDLEEDHIRSLVVEYDARPEQPDDDKDEMTTRGLTDLFWTLIEQCWTKEKAKRPTFPDISVRLRPLITSGRRSKVESSSISSISNSSGGSTVGSPQGPAKDLGKPSRAPQPKPSPPKTPVKDTSLAKSKLQNTPSLDASSPPHRHKVEEPQQRIIFIFINATRLIKHGLLSPYPYAVLSVDDERKFSTQPKSGTVSPEWRQCVEISVRPSSTVSIEILDEKKLKQPAKASLGQISISGEYLISNANMARILTVHEKDLTAFQGNSAVRGTFYYSVQKPMPRGWSLMISSKNDVLFHHPDRVTPELNDPRISSVPPGVSSFMKSIFG